MNSSFDLEAIDVHGHYGEYSNAVHPLANTFRSADLQAVSDMAGVARTAITIVSPIEALTPRGSNDPITANEHAQAEVPHYSRLCFWVVIDPLREETFSQAERILPHDKCMGIKIHPEEHCYPIREQGRTLFEFAQRHGAVMLTHSGEQNSLPADFVPFCNDFPDVSLILAHLGCGFDGDPTQQVRAIQSTRSENVYVDTSSAQSMMPNLIEWGVSEVGADKVLYGTDAPLYFAPMQRVRIDEAAISGSDKRLILRDNAIGLLPVKI